jgi:hypothetical protein
MHWRFGTGYLCPWTADLTKEKKKKFVSLGAAVNGFLPNQSALFSLNLSTKWYSCAVVLQKFKRYPPQNGTRRDTQNGTRRDARIAVLAKRDAAGHPRMGP